MVREAKSAVLLVDDDARVLTALQRLLREKYDVSIASSATEALETLKHQTFAVIVSDYRMPGMDGIALLNGMQKSAPNTVRVLISGQADLNAAVRAINEGQLFRFVHKPCQPSELLSAVAAAVEQHRLLTAERELL
jgi:DNA-binding NtrC family response regulator